MMNLESSQRPLRTLAGAIVLPVALLVVTTAAGMPAEARAAAEKHALLIGINQYKSAEIPPLAGCLNDVEAMKQILEGRFGFPDANIKTLTDRQATRKAILAGLQDLVARAQSGDRVYIHFSGHGSQVKDMDGDEKDDGLDETLLPYDSRTKGVADITDDELSDILSGLRTRDALIVLDACHSGTATRSVAIRTRSVPQDTRTALYSGRKTKKIGTRAIASEAEPQYVVMSATGPRESALDAVVDGVPRGIFSLALSTVLSVAETVVPPIRILSDAKKVLGTVQDKIGATQLPVPQLEGPAALLQQALFGGAGAGAAPDMQAMAETTADVPVNGGFADPGVPASPAMAVRMAPLGPGMVLLVGGALVGATPGAYWAVYDDEQAANAGSAPVASAEIVAIRGQDAEARVTPAEFVPGGKSRATAVTSAAPEPAIRVDLRGPRAVLRGLQSAIQQRFGQVVFVGPQDFSTFLVEITASSGTSPTVSISGAGGLQLLDRFPWSDEAQAAERLAPLLRRSYNADAIKSLSNPATRIALNVGVVGAPGGADDPRGVQVVPSSDRARYRIRSANDPRSFQNSLMLEVESNVDCYLTIVDVDTEGRATVLFPNPHAKSGFLPSGFVAARNRVRIPDALREPNEAGFFWDYSPPAGLDVVQVFAATDLETATKLRAYLASFAGQSAGGTASRGLDATARPLSDLRAELAKISPPRGISVVRSESTDGAPPASVPGAARDWTAVPVTINVEP